MFISPGEKKIDSSFYSSGLPTFVKSVESKFTRKHRDFWHCVLWLEPKDNRQEYIVLRTHFSLSMVLDSMFENGAETYFLGSSSTTML